MQLIEGGALLNKKKVAIVVGKFNSFITEKLLEGAKASLFRYGLSDHDLTVTWAPGAFEIPLLAQKLAKTGKFQGIVCLGAVIRGGTPHFDYVCNEVAKGISYVALQFDLPVSFGVLTTDTLEQAIDRAGGKAGNKGVDAALAVIEMINLCDNIEKTLE
jgi:6,7-dimethyl-8-ribityllumazine synthase